MTTLPAAPATGSHWVHNLDPVALDLGFFQLRWYSLAYLAGIVIGYMYLLRLVKQPGSPMARRHADDMVFYATLGIILGGRLGYVLFYKPMDYLNDPLAIVKLWDGGMSFHGGLLGTILAMLYLARKNGLSFLRVSDYVACCVPFGLFFGRLANFVNGELWGRPSDVAWAVQFRELVGPGRVEVGPPRHPSQLYEAGLEGILLFLVLFVLFWWTRARYKPGLLAGVFTLGYGLSRFVVEYFREPDAHLMWLAEQTGLSMGQWLTVPMILIGLYLIVTARTREPIHTPSGEPPADAVKAREAA
ncbi:prolipoprotein diacylglyceryl transferase [Sphingosinicella sp. YJ22]|uniref:prolipoprotein diacylglyceryl transferase n=1 Tax=Sphingosinicella sp. YJ22 TaxID=1104780 RepID=UPI001FAFDE8A|nr:prolipoprotein diacylglyceryl transferase [Sphingosinicella sp. YJ22]